MKTLGCRLFELLKAKDMTQKELAYTIGVSEVSISRYVNNGRKPRAIVLYKIAEVLGVSVEYLLTGNKKEEYGKWIPVSEGLPKKHEDALTTTRYDGFLGRYGTWIETGFINDIGEWSGACIGCKVIAWMPLPKPYKESN